MSSPSSSSASEASSSPRLKRKRNEDSARSDTDSDTDSVVTSSNSSDSESDSEDADATPEVSALSHAERRRHKKKGNQQETADTPSASKRRKPTSTALPKRQHSVWVGNLSFKTTIESLKTFFDGVGEITRVHMPMKATASNAKPENRGFAYVDFATPEAKAAAIARSEKHLIGRRLLIKDGDDFTGRPALGAAEGDASNAAEQRPGYSKTAQKILRAQKQPPAPTLFLGNLGFEATEKSIRELLDAHRIVKKKSKGEEDAKPPAKDKWIRKVRLGTFEDSGLCKGFAFVDFTSIDHATSALINPKNHHLDGRKLVMEYASADAVRRGGGGPKLAKEDRTRKGGQASDDVDREGQEPPKKRKKTEEVQRVYESAQSRNEEAPHFRPRSGKDKGPRVRPKPGAALALAKRESAAILPSTGKKIIF